jgi:hypothetical protein
LATPRYSSELRSGHLPAATSDMERNANLEDRIKEAIEDAGYTFEELSELTKKRRH